MTMKANVTIVTPVYNTQDYIHRCVKSILGQKGVDLRLILIDDGSTDRSSRILRQYALDDKRVLFVQKQNGGQGGARNLGISLADSKYVYFVDSDDHLGEGTLNTLYRMAESRHLDLCSPRIPKYYFDRPLEFISCIPCKGQFISLDLIRQADIRQPDARSGQDGVFSHLVLTQCRRIGMAEDAIFHYTHARENSTFAAYLGRPECVPEILEQHYAAIGSFYDRLGLWKKNAVRLIDFVLNESLKNRIVPHYERMDPDLRRRSLMLLAEITRKAYQFVSEEYEDCFPDSVYWLMDYHGHELAAQSIPIPAAGERLRVEPYNVARAKGLTVYKYVDPDLVPDRVNLVPAAEAKEVRRGSQILDEIRRVRKKLDYAINTVNNHACAATFLAGKGVSDLSGGEEDVVVSLTTLPSRIDSVHLAIESIFSQTTRPSRIILWVSDRMRRRDLLTGALKHQMKRGLEIVSVPDVGPHTKLVYAMRRYPDKSVITIDDDLLYPSGTIKMLIDHSRRFPGVIIANWARELSFGEYGMVSEVREGRLLTPPTLEQEVEQNHFVPQPSLLAFAYGTGGVLYPPKSLDERFDDVCLFRKLCPKEDDIWFKAMSLLKGTAVVPTNLGFNPKHFCLAGTQSQALRHQNHDLERHGEQMRAVFGHFDLYSAFECNRGSPEIAKEDGQ